MSICNVTFCLIQNVTPDPRKSCGPYKPVPIAQTKEQLALKNVGPDNHDTIGMILFLQ